MFIINVSQLRETELNSKIKKLINFIIITHQISMKQNN